MSTAQINNIATSSPEYSNSKLVTIRETSHLEKNFPGELNSFYFGYKKKQCAFAVAVNELGETYK